MVKKSLVGKTFNRLTIRNEYQSPCKKYVLCECSCSCGGKTTKTRRHDIVSGKIVSCGCLRLERLREVSPNNPRSRKQPGTRKVDDRRYKMFHNAQHRAKIKGIPFSITIDDIIIPETCPLLGIPLVSTNDKRDPRNPSLDQKEPGKGYTPDNIWVVSSRANWIKCDASLQELELLVENLKCFSSSSHS